MPFPNTTQHQAIPIDFASRPNYEFLRSGDVVLIRDRSDLHQRKNGVIDDDLIEAFNCATNKIFSQMAQFGAGIRASTEPRGELIVPPVEDWTSRAISVGVLHHGFKFRTERGIKFFCTYIECSATSHRPQAIQTLAEQGIINNQFSDVQHYRVLTGLVLIE